MHLRWNLQRLRSNLQIGEILCPHEEVRRPWIISPSIVHRDKDTKRTRTMWNPGPTIRKCCVKRGEGLAIAAWWWEVDNRFEDLKQFLLPVVELAEALLEQEDDIRAQLALQVPLPSEEYRQRYIWYREDLGLTTRRVRVTPPSVKRLGLPWPCTIDEVEKRWKVLARETHPDRGGNANDFHIYNQAYKEVKEIFERPKDDSP